MIEEDIDLRSLIRDLLERMGYWVITVPLTEQRQRIFEVAAQVDLVVSDVTMPDSEGIGLTEELLDRFAGLAAVVIATDDSEFLVQKRFGKKRTRFLLKPFSFEELRGAVERALALRAVAPLSDEAAAQTEVPAAILHTARPMPGRQLASWALMAAAALVIVSGVVLRGFEPGPPPLPDSVPSTVKRGETVRVVEPMGDLPSLPSSFVWDDVADAAGYRVRILAVDDEVLWQGLSDPAPMALPSEATGRLHAGVVYFWTVEALDADGGVVARSQRTRFQVVPPRVE